MQDYEQSSQGAQPHDAQGCHRPFISSHKQHASTRTHLQHHSWVTCTAPKPCTATSTRQSAGGGGGGCTHCTGLHKLKPCKNCVSFSLTQRQLFPKGGTQDRSVDASPAKPQLQNDLEGEGWHCSGRCWASLLQIEVLAAPPTVCLAAAGEKGLSSIEVLSQSPRLPPH